jgi:hypothetical protein
MCDYFVSWHQYGSRSGSHCTNVLIRNLTSAVCGRFVNNKCQTVTKVDQQAECCNMILCTAAVGQMLTVPSNRTVTATLLV